MTASEIYWQMELLVRLLSACVLGLSIGFERKNRNKIAGVRTHAIVAFGAALMMIISKYGFEDLNGNYDAARIAAQTVSGVGFIGAGIIFMKDRNSVSGLTTAAGIWATAGVGMSMGAGLYFISIMSAVILIVMQEMLHRIGFLSHESHRTNVNLTIENAVDIKELQTWIRKEQVEIETCKLSKGDKTNTQLEMELVFFPQFDKISFLIRLAAYPGVIVIRE